MLMELCQGQQGAGYRTVSMQITYASWWEVSQRIGLCLRGGTYNGDFATELVLDLAFLDRIRSFVLDDLEKLFDTHLVTKPTPGSGVVVS
jgi:hypothetical protein